MKDGENISIADKYHPAMQITDQEAADKYFEELVRHTMSFGKPRAEAEQLERTNLGYFTGYYSNEVRARVERLFKCEHPGFGSIAKNGAPTFAEALEAGIRAGEKVLREQAGIEGKN